MTAPGTISTDATNPSDAVSAITGTPVKVRALRACTVTVGRTGIKPDAAVLFALALYLAMRAGEHVTRGEVIALLWPDGEDTSRRHALRQLLYRLKRAGMPVGGDGDELSLQLENVDCDLARLLTEGWAASVSLADLPAPRDVLPGYEPAVAQPFHEWIDGVRTRAAAAIRHAALRHIQSARLEGRWADVNRVARLCIEADPLNEEANLALAESIAMSGSKAEALRMLDSYFIELGDHGKTVGLSTQLLRRRISDQPAYRVPRPSDPPLIGREEDIAWLNSRLELARQKQMSTAMLAGPPGIGKTALMRAFASHAEMRGWRFVESRLQPSDVDRPMSVFVELLPTLMKASGALGAAPESIAQLRQLFEHGAADEILANKSREAEAVQARIRTSMLDLVGAVAEEGPVVLVLEDLHWIDRQSLRLLSWLLDHSSHVPMMWLLTARLEGRFVELRETFAPDQVPVRPINPLDRPGSMDLFRACISESESKRGRPLPAHAYDITGGNPLFIREVAGHWAETGGSEALPNNLKAVMRGRVARLSPAAQRVLHCCAVLGRFATVQRVSAALELNTSDLLACIEEVDGLGLLGLGGEPGSLALHDLWKEDLVFTLRDASRALIHLRCGELLASESAGTKSASTISEAARHLVAAGATAKALRLLEDAAKHQMANGLCEDAAASCELALAHVSAEDERVALLSLLVNAFQQSGAWNRALQVFKDNPLLANRSAGHTSTEIAYLEALWRTGENAQGALQGALRCAEDSASPSDHRLHACLVAARCGANRFDKSAMVRALAVVRSIDVDAGVSIGPALAVRVIVESEIGSPAAAAVHADELIRHARTVGDVCDVARALRFGSYTRRISGDLPAALRLASEAYEIAASGQLTEQASLAGDVCAAIFLESGEFERCAEWLDRTSKWAIRVSPQYARRSLAILRARLNIHQGQINAAAAVLETIDTMPASSAREHLAILEVRLRVLTARNQGVELREAVDEVASALEGTREFVLQDSYVGAFLTALMALGRADEATSYARQYQTLWRRSTHPLPAEIASHLSI